MISIHCAHVNTYWRFRRRPRPISLTWAGEQWFTVLRDGFESFKKALTIVGTDSVMNLKAGEADTAVRYADAAPAGRVPIAED